MIDGQGGQVVRAARAGRLFINEFSFGTAGGYVVIEVQLPGGHFEYDAYIHINPDTNLPPLNCGTCEISQGQRIGTIDSANPEYPAGTRHLGYTVLSEAPPANAIPDPRTYRNPFLRFSANIDIDPLSSIPWWNYSDENRADENTVYRSFTAAPSGTTNPFADGVIWGDVDLIADVYDQMNTSEQWDWGVAAPIFVGWYVKPFYVDTHGIKSEDEPYVLARFDDNWFADIQGDDNEAREEWVRARYEVVYATALSVWNPLAAEKVLNFVVTNTNGTDGRITSVANLYWRTDALDDGAPDDSEHANYADMLTTNRNANARFKDGDYEIHIILDDASGKYFGLKPDVRIANFVRVPRNGPANNAVAAPAGATQPLYDTSIPRDFGPDFVPAPSEASSTFSYLFGEMVAVGGNGETGYLDTNYYPNLLMDVYVVPHRIWNEGDSLSAGAVHHSLVQSDSEGSIPLTQVWSSTQVGEFDLIVDYDNDGKFSWKLDGLTAFTVNKGNTYTMVGTSPNPSTFGQNVLISAQVGVMSPAAGTPTGTVSFFDGSALLGNSQLSPSGWASIRLAH
ncbi:MAG: Ig-like domain-containing protein [Gemmataceae bacterium]|nr:Ig-like domain-containing protein [Gemmataceae bacterium]